MNERYEFIDGEKGNFPVKKMCAWIEVSKSGFYDWRSGLIHSPGCREKQQVTGV